MLWGSEVHRLIGKETSSCAVSFFVCSRMASSPELRYNGAVYHTERLREKRSLESLEKLGIPKDSV